MFFNGFRLREIGMYIYIYIYILCVFHFWFMFFISRLRDLEIQSQHVEISPVPHSEPDWSSEALFRGGVAKTIRNENNLK